MMARMYQTGDTCKKCGKPLYETTLTKRVWCKECREYKDDEEDKVKNKKWWEK